MTWLQTLWQRLFGYQLAGRTRLYPIDPDERSRHTLPTHMPVPPEVYRSWPKGSRRPRLSHAQMAELAGRFANARPNHWLTRSLRLFATKAPLAQKVEDALQKTQWAVAEMRLHEILEIDGGDDRARLLLGLSLQQQGKMDEAQDCYDRVAPSMAAEADFHAFQGGLHQARREMDAAKQAYRRALELRSDHPLALQGLAAFGELVEIYLGDLDHPEKAFLPVEEYERFIAEAWEKEGQSAQCFLGRSEFHLRSAQPNLALKAADRAQTALEEASGPAGAAGAATPADRAAVLAARCRALIALERYEEAEKDLTALQSLAPEGEETLSCFGHLLWFRGDRQAAGEWIRRAIESNPNRMENLHLYLDPGFPKKTSSPLTALTDLMNDHPQAWGPQSLAASIHMAGGGWKEGVRLALAAAEGGAQDEVLVELTGRMGRQDLHRDVVRLVEKAGGWRRFLKGHVLLRSNLAVSLSRVGQTDAAEALWRSVRDDPMAHPKVRIRAREALQSEPSGAPR